MAMLKKRERKGKNRREKVTKQNKMQIEMEVKSAVC
jgi:hypothetical protein